MKPEYLFWAAAIMAALLVFSIGILCIGYQTLTFGRLMTMVVLSAGSVACFVLYRKRR